MEVLPPGVQDRQKTDRRAQTFGIGRDREQCFRCGAEQDAIDLARILKRQPADLLRQRKHDVEIRDRQQFGFPFGQPLWRAPWPGTLGNACCGMSCTR